MSDSTTEFQKKEAEMSILDQVPENAEEGFAYFWEKEASSPEAGTHDEAVVYRIELDVSLKKLLYDLKRRTLGKEIPFDEINPKDTGIIKWIPRVLDSYPKLESDRIDDILTSFRGRLRTSSKKQGAFIVGALLLPEKLLLVHSRIDPGLFKDKDIKGKMRTADLVLHSNSVLRAAMIKSSEDGMFLSAYEYDRSLSKGHAEFWGINPRYVRWEKPSSVRFVFRLGSSNYTVERPATFDEIADMFDKGEITPTGDAHIGTQEAIIESVEMGRRSYTFDAFYQQYVMVSEDVAGHRNYFRSLVNPTNLMAFDSTRSGVYEYEEDTEYLYRITPSEHIELKEKKHGHYLLCFFTSVFPGIRPMPLLTTTFHKALFTNAKAAILHVGEPVKIEPLRIGNLQVFNEVEIENSALEFVNELLDKITDASSKKLKILLQTVAVRYLRRAIDNEHLPLVFDFIFNDILHKSLNNAFKKPALLAKEEIIEFKSKDAFLSKPKQFVTKKLVPTILKYVKGSKLTRLCIIYGIEDDGTINAISNLPSDRVTDIEKRANKELLKNGISIEAFPIKAKGGSLFLVIIFQD